MDIKATGCFLGDLRKEKGLKQREVAELIGVSDKAISRWETGRGIPDVGSLQSLSDFYGVSINEILAGRYIKEDEIKIITDQNVKEMAKKQSRLKRKLRVVMIGIVVLVILLAAYLVFNLTETCISATRGYSVSDIDKLFEDVADLEEEGIEYRLWVDSTNKTILMGVEVYHHVGIIEDKKFEPSELKQLPIK